MIIFHIIGPLIISVWELFLKPISMWQALIVESPLVRMVLPKWVWRTLPCLGLCLEPPYSTQRKPFLNSIRTQIVIAILNDECQRFIGNISFYYGSKHENRRLEY